MENEAEGPKFDLWLPPVPLWLLSGHPERSSPPQAAKSPAPAPAGANPPGPGAVDSGRGWDSPPAPPAAQPTLQGGGGHHPPSTTAQLVPHRITKARVQTEEPHALGNPPRQRQRWGRQRQSPHHPRLCENHKRSLIGGPRKKGVQGGDSMENEAEGPKFDLWLPPVPLWLLSGHPERSSPPQAAKYSRPGAPGANNTLESTRKNSYSPRCPNTPIPTVTSRKKSEGPPQSRPALRSWRRRVRPSTARGNSGHSMGSGQLVSPAEGGDEQGNQQGNESFRPLNQVCRSQNRPLWPAEQDIILSVSSMRVGNKPQGDGHDHGQLVDGDLDFFQGTQQGFQPIGEKNGGGGRGEQERCPAMSIRMRITMKKALITPSQVMVRIQN